MRLAGLGWNGVLLVLAGQITLSRPADHEHTWKFFRTDYQEWTRGYLEKDVDTQFLLSWFTPHSNPDLCKFLFEGSGITGKTKNFHFGEFRLVDGKLGAAFSPLCNPSHFKFCSCKTGCPSSGGCRQGNILPCRPMCFCKSSCRNHCQWGEPIV